MRPTLTTIIGTTALVAALAAGALAFSASAHTDSVDARYERLGAALDALGDDLAEERAARRKTERSIVQLGRSLEDLSARIGSTPPVDPPAAAVPTTEVPVEEERVRDFDELRRRVMAGEATSDEATRFWELAKTSDALPAIIGRLEAAVAASPGDSSARLRLARALVAKLYSVPNGPARGAWASKAETQWEEVLRRDAGNWEARFSMAVSYSQWPAMFGKGPAAVEHLQTLVEQQESRAPLAHESAVYHLLADMHRRAGNSDAATSALEAGAQRHPTDDRLRAAVDEARR